MDLKGADCFFWVENNDGRWHRTANPLAIGNGEWEDNIITLDATPGSWTCTYDRNGNDPSLDLTKITSFGFSFIGFPLGDKVTGLLKLDHFYIKYV